MWKLACLIGEHSISRVMYFDYNVVELFHWFCRGFVIVLNFDCCFGWSYSLVSVTWVVPTPVLATKRRLFGVLWSRMWDTADNCTGRRALTPHTCVDAEKIASSRERHGGNGAFGATPPSKMLRMSIDAIWGVMGSFMSVQWIWGGRLGIQKYDAMVDINLQKMEKIFLDVSEVKIIFVSREICNILRTEISWLQKSGQWA